MDDDEAVSVLLALGGVLEWETLCYEDSFNVHAQREDGAYYILLRTAKRHRGDLFTIRMRPYLHHINGVKQFNHIRKMRLAEAKAVCEYHNLTGKWPA